MASKSKARKRRRRKPAKEKPVDVVEREDTGPTPETRDKLRPDTIQAMTAAGMIDDAGVRAIEEIRRVRAAIVYELEAKPNKFSNIARGIREMPDDVAEAHAKRYLPWAEETFPASKLVIAVVTEQAETKSPELQKSIADCIRDYARRF